MSLVAVSSLPRDVVVGVADDAARSFLFPDTASSNIYPFFRFCFFFFNDTATTEIYTLSLHDALPISRGSISGARADSGSPKLVPRAALMLRTVSVRRRMPREVPLTSSITPLRARACRCSSAALADLKPSVLAISARVGGAPVREMAAWIRSRICCWRAVSLGWSSMACVRSLRADGRLGGHLMIYTVSVFLTSFPRGASGAVKVGDSGHGRDHRRPGGFAVAGRGVQGRADHGAVAAGGRAGPGAAGAGARADAADRAGGQQGYGLARVARVAARLHAGTGGCGYTRRGDHAWNGHAGRDGLAAAQPAAGHQTHCVDLRHAPGHCPVGRWTAESARCRDRGCQRRAQRRMGGGRRRGACGSPGAEGPSLPAAGNALRGRRAAGVGGRRACALAGARRAVRARSEEHTSELQSQSNLVCRLLLEKKKKK